MVDLTFVIAALAVFVAAYVLQLYVDFKRYEAAMGYIYYSITHGQGTYALLTLLCSKTISSNLPGYRTLLSPATILANMIPIPIPGVTPGRNWAFRQKYKGGYVDTIGILVVLLSGCYDEQTLRGPERMFSVS